MRRRSHLAAVLEAVGRRGGAVARGSGLGELKCKLVRWAMNKQGCTSVALSERGGRRPRHALVVQAQRQVAELSLPQLHQHASVTSFVLRGVAQAAG